MDFFNSGKIFYGGDYNPEQWLENKDILKKDIDYMKEAHINVVTMGIFAWSSLESEEDSFNFDWMEERINTLYENGISVILATPSGSRPKWLAEKYPEVLRVNADRTRNLYGFRHNHCYTSVQYRNKVRNIDKKLAEKFGNHPGVIAWHISNEFGGECHCPLCQQAFREWLQKKYVTIDNLNKKWMTTFWSHTYQNFNQIESPSPKGEPYLHALNLDWRRFVTDQTKDFAKCEIDSIREGGSDKPVTTNMMHDFNDLNYFKFADILDFISWDSYPEWHSDDDRITALDTELQHDLMRCIKKQPFYLLESCPTGTNWQRVSKLKYPGLLQNASLQAVAHGSDSVLYFQNRQSRGTYEKFHGAVISHYGGNDTRVFEEVKETGNELRKLEEIQGTRTVSRVAVIYDWENRWAVNDAAGLRNIDKCYKEAVNKSYFAFRNNGFNVDIIDMEASLDEYDIVVAPMLYLFRDKIDEKLKQFVAAGGTLIMTYWSGIVDETDLCFLGGSPYGLTEVLGIRSEEVDALYDGETNYAVTVTGNSLHMSGEYLCEHYSDLIKTKDAEILMVYKNHFYAGKPALTRNFYGKGEAYYICGDFEQKFYNDFYEQILKERKLQPIIFGWNKESRMLISSRESEKYEYIFIQNFDDRKWEFPEETGKLEVLSGNSGEKLEPYHTVILKRVKIR